LINNECRPDQKPQKSLSEACPLTEAEFAPAADDARVAKIGSARWLASQSAAETVAPGITAFCAVILPQNGYMQHIRT
jgi:hypothetical protein